MISTASSERHASPYDFPFLMATTTGSHVLSIDSILPFLLFVVARYFHKEKLLCIKYLMTLRSSFYSKEREKIFYSSLLFPGFQSNALIHCHTPNATTEITHSFGFMGHMVSTELLSPVVAEKKGEMIWKQNGGLFSNTKQMGVAPLGQNSTCQNKVWVRLWPPSLTFTLHNLLGPSPTACVSPTVNNVSASSTSFSHTSHLKKDC